MKRLTSPVVTLVGSISIGLADKQARIFIEHVPGDFIDVEGKSLQQATHVAGPEDHTAPDKTLYDAILIAQRVGARLLRNVVPENLFFIFGESTQALGKIALELPLVKGSTNLFGHPLAGINQQQRQTEQKAEANDLAIVFCKVRNAKLLRPLIRGEERDAKHEAECYQVAWSELESLKEMFGKFSEHREMVAEGCAA